MDFHTLSRRDLQALCKKNHIPANVTNVAMANALQALQMVEGIEELQEALNFQSPKTTQRTGSHKPVGPAEDQASSLPRSRRVTSRTPAALNLADEEEKKKDVVAETPKVPNTRRRAGQKDESKEIVETMRKSTRTSVVRGVEAQKEEKVVGVTTGRRTRGTVKKEVELVSGGMRRSSRARGIAMASLAKEEQEEGKVESGEVVVETTEEKIDDKAEELEEQKVDDNAEEQEEERVEDKAEQVDEVDDTAEEQEKVDDKADEVEEEKVETGEVAVETNEEKVDKKAEEQEEEKVDSVNDKAEQEKFVDKAGENEEMTDDVAEHVEEKETNDIMEEGEIKSSDQTYYHDLIMSEDGDFPDQMSDLQSEEMVVETRKEDQVDDKAEQDEVEIDDQVDHEKEETDDEADEKLEDNVEPEEETMDVQAELEEEKLDYQAEGKLEDKPENEEEEEQIDDQIEQEEESEMEDTVEEEIKSLEGNTCNDLVMVVDEESVDQKNDIKYEEMTIQGQKLEDKPEEEEEQIDDQIEQEEEREMEDIVEEEIKSLEGNTCNDLVMGVDEESVDQKNDIKYEEMVMQGEKLGEKLEDNPEEEEEEIDDQIEQQEEGEMEDTVEEEMKSLEGNTRNDLVMAVDEESVDQKNDIKYEEMAAVMAMQGEKLENKPEQQEEEQTDDHVEHEEENEMDDIVEEEIQSLENSSDIIISQVEGREECSEFVEEAAIIDESSPIRCPKTSDQTSSNEEQQNPILTNDESGKETGNVQIGELIDNLSDLNLSLKEDIRDPITCDQTSGNEEQQNRDAEEDEDVKRSSGNIQIGELIDNLSDLNLSLKEEIKAAGDGVLPRRENNNKENSWVAKSKTQKHYEDMSLRKLKAAYKEVVVAINKGEEKRAALKIIDENCS